MPSTSCSVCHFNGKCALSYKSVSILQGLFLIKQMREHVQLRCKIQTNEPIDQRSHSYQPDRNSVFLGQEEESPSNMCGFFFFSDVKRKTELYVGGSMFISEQYMITTVRI